MNNKYTNGGSSKSSKMVFESKGVPLYYQLESILLEKVHSGFLPVRIRKSRSATAIRNDIRRFGLANTFVG
jgi:hypothetical protein